MDTTITLEETTSTLPNVQLANNMRECGHCNVPYDWRRSPSGSLKMTFCNSLCERAHLGFTIESLLQAQRSPWGAVLAQTAA